MRTSFAVLALGVVLPFGLACSAEENHSSHAVSGQQVAAVADLQPSSGSSVSGSISFERKSEKEVRVTAHVTGLTPGKHGMHIHEKGDCSAPDASSAGPHYNPTGHAHGEPSAEHHMGDLGNIEADANGEAHLDLSVDFVDLDGPNSVIGKAVIVHAQPDDLTSQPAGNAGARVACGVIRKK